MTQVGVVARRDFSDANGFVTREIFYVSTESSVRPSCAEGTLRVYMSRDYQRDALGRVLVETDLGPDGIVQHVWRLEYRGEEKAPSRRVQYDPAGIRRFEIRSEGGDGDPTDLHFDARGDLVAVRGTLPAELAGALGWGAMVDGWRCGIAVDRWTGVLYLHLRNDTTSETNAHFLDAFDSELRDAQSAILPVTERARMAGPGWTGILIGPGEMAFRHFQLERRYGRLPRGRYTVVVRHPHPITGGMLVSNSLQFDVP